MTTTITITIIDDDGNRYQLPTAGLSIFAKRSKNTARCDDCGVWADAGDDIRHGRHCDTPDLQAEWVRPETTATTETHAPLTEIRRYARQGEVGRFSEDEIELAHALGHISTSEAMNRDF